MACSENSGKPGYYSVRPGDTLTKIALDHGQAWRDIAKWNGLDNPNIIEVDQVLRVAPPLMEAAANRQTKPVTAQNQVPPSSATSNTPTPTATSATTSNTPSASPPANASDDGMAFAWPHPGPVLAGFD